jgi:Holliday junction DNA helicase RuvA
MDGHAALIAMGGGGTSSGGGGGGSGGGGGVVYEVLLPAFLSERLQSKVGQMVTLTTFHYLEGQGQGTSFIPRLIGFTSVREREFFELFTTVKGIGNRKALRAMAIEPSAIAGAIAQKNASALVKLPEIGKRMAETIIAELTGKVEGYLSDSEVAGLDVKAGGVLGGGAPYVQETILALVALGETNSDAERLVARAVDRASRDGVALVSVESLLNVVFAVRGG